MKSESLIWTIFAGQLELWYLTGWLQPWVIKPDLRPPQTDSETSGTPPPFPQHPPPDHEPPRNKGNEDLVHQL